MPKPPHLQFGAIARARGTSMRQIAKDLCVSRGHLYASLGGKFDSPGARSVAAKARAMLGMDEPEAIAYTPGLCSSSTGLNLPIELHNFCRTEVAQRRESSISAMCRAALEEKYGSAIRAYVAGGTVAKKHHLARTLQTHAVVPKSPTSAS